MTNNSDGLTPTLRPQLGVGWNRALPAPFGFDNGIVPDGINDYLSVPNNQSNPLPLSGSIEFWTKDSNYRVGFNFRDNVNSLTFGLNGFPNNGGSVLFGNLNNFQVNPYGSLGGSSVWNVTGLYHWVVAWDMSARLLHLYKNTALTTTTISGGALTQTGYDVLQIGNSSISYFNYKMDELRIYRKMLSKAEVLLNYNSGAGENPCETEFLTHWYKFEQFENLDFSALQDNSDIRLGIRDLSGNNNHAQPVNMDTNPASPTYVLQPF